MSAALASPSLSALSAESEEVRQREMWVYVEPGGPIRELVILDGQAGSTLIVDRIACGGADGRLVAHLPADEPHANAALVCEMYLADSSRGRCAKLNATDMTIDPLPPAAPNPEGFERQLTDAHGHQLRLRRVDGPYRPLRWTRSLSPRSPQRFEVISLRAAVGCLQAYEPILTLTAQAASATPGLASERLRAELAQVKASPTVLNARLRAAVLAATRGAETTLSAIAAACGHSKIDRDGSHDDEASWLKRRIGLADDGMGGPATPWVDQRVLDLIATHGLGLAPIEVEVPRSA